MKYIFLHIVFICIILCLSSKTLFANSPTAIPVTENYQTAEQLDSNTSDEDDSDVQEDSESKDEVTAKDVKKKKKSESTDDRIAELEKELEKIKKKQKETKNQFQKADEKSEQRRKLLQPGGSLYVVGGIFDQNESSHQVCGDQPNDLEISRARLSLSGEFQKQFRYELEMDFADGKVKKKDCYGEINSMPIISDLRLGYFKEAMGVEQMTNSNDIWFIYRSMASSVLKDYVMGRSYGLSLSNASRKNDIIWNVGFYRRKVNEYDDIEVGKEYKTNVGWGVTTRLVALLFEDACHGFNLHVGMSYSWREWDAELGMQFSTKGECPFGENILSSGWFTDTTNTHTFAPELIFSAGRFAIMAEYYFCQLINHKNADYSDPSIQGGYVQLAYTLTGEKFEYKKGKGSLDGITPTSPFNAICKENEFTLTSGAWFVAYRFSWADLSDVNSEAIGSRSSTHKKIGDNSLIGTGYTHTFGVNWVWNKYARVMLDYSYTIVNYDYQPEYPHGYSHAVVGAFELKF